MKNLIIPDIHGRSFWKSACANIDDYDKVIFLGDYLDPYGFEGISEEEAMKNFVEIIHFAVANKDKVVLLLGNHDMPYFSDEYYRQSDWWDRHSVEHHDEARALFDEHRPIFVLAYEDDTTIYTHAGIVQLWLDEMAERFDLTLNPAADDINALLEHPDGPQALFTVGRARGGFGRAGSPVWADVHEHYYNKLNGPENPKFQIFGHTLQALWDEEGNLVYGNQVVGPDWAMLDNGKPYIYNTETYELTN